MHTDTYIERSERVREPQEEDAEGGAASRRCRQLTPSHRTPPPLSRLLSPSSSWCVGFAQGKETERDGRGRGTIPAVVARSVATAGGCAVVVHAEACHSRRQAVVSFSLF
ncbi:uncharacterized protein DS421_18g627360 [Arachis hypogaea]|nr:uncharacterized protein LOC112769114 [Arachis hypogaea]QHN97436.1 uncharacterized protein DS421_18g627360 [Arachis hypogaea]